MDFTTESGGGLAYHYTPYAIGSDSFTYYVYETSDETEFSLPATVPLETIAPAVGIGGGGDIPLNSPEDPSNLQPVSLSIDGIDAHTWATARPGHEHWENLELHIMLGDQTTGSDDPTPSSNLALWASPDKDPLPLEYNLPCEAQYVPDTIYVEGTGYGLGHITFAMYAPTDDNSTPHNVSDAKTDVNVAYSLVARDDYYTTLHDISLTEPSPSILANDTGSNVEVVRDSNPSNGCLQYFYSDGRFQYWPNTSYVGEDPFTYHAYDGQQSSNTATVGIGVRNLTLHSVAFLESKTIKSDPDAGGGTFTYTAPQWLDAHDDGSVTGPDDHHYPVAYVQETEFEVTATFKLSGDWAGKPIEIHGLDPTDSIDIPWTLASVDGPTVTITAWAEQAFRATFTTTRVLKSSGPRIQGETGEIPAGVSDNELFVTYDEPVGLRYRTCYWIGCRAAEGLNDAEQALMQTWLAFSGNSVTRWDGITLWYYGDYAIAPLHEDTTSLLTPITTDAGVWGDGDCGSWPRLLADTWHALGLSPANDLVTVRPAQPASGPRPWGFLVKNWHFPATGKSNDAIVSFTGPELSGFTRNQIVSATHSSTCWRSSRRWVNPCRQARRFHTTRRMTATFSSARPT